MVLEIGVVIVLSAVSVCNPLQRSPLQGSPVSSIITSIESPNAAERVAALDRIAAMREGAELLIPRVIQLLHDAAVVGRQEPVAGGGMRIVYTSIGQIAADVLAGLGDASREALLKAAGSGSWFGRENAVKALGKLHRPGTIRPILEFARDAALASRLERSIAEDVKGSLTAIIRMHDPADLDSLEKELFSTDAKTAAGMTLVQLFAEALAFGGEKASAAVTRAIEGEDAFVRCAVLWGLGSAGASDAYAETKVFDVLRHYSSPVRACAARALSRGLSAAYLGGVRRGSTGEVPRRRIEALIMLLRDRDRRVREAAGWSLREIALNDFGTDWSKWDKWWKTVSRKYTGS